MILLGYCFEWSIAAFSYCLSVLSVHFEIESFKALARVKYSYTLYIIQLWEIKEKLEGSNPLNSIEKILNIFYL